MLNTPKTLYKAEKAAQVAETLTATDEDGWQYVACHDSKGTGGSYIEVYDADGVLVGAL